MRSLSSSRRSSVMDLDVSTGHRTSSRSTRERSFLRMNRSESGFRYSYSNSRKLNETDLNDRTISNGENTLFSVRIIKNYFYYIFLIFLTGSRRHRRKKQRIQLSPVCRFLGVTKMQLFFSYAKPFSIFSIYFTSISKMVMLSYRTT